MPLLDHFRPPLSVQRPWEGIHGAWAAAIAAQLNEDLLPPEYFAMPLVTVGGQVEVDVGTFQETASLLTGNGALATATWAPPKPVLTASLDSTAQDGYEIQVLQELGGPKLRAAIELVSPSNKDRPSNRRALAIKCAAYLEKGIAVILVDVVTERMANFHADLVELFRLGPSFAWKTPSGLYAIAYRLVSRGAGRQLEAWPEALAISAALPTLPLWLDDELCIPLNLEESYLATCASLRIAVA